MSHSTEQLTSPQSGSNRPTSVVHAGIEHGPRVQRQSTRVQHLITADETSLLELETPLVTLPICSTGRVFIEVPGCGIRHRHCRPGAHDRHVARSFGIAPAPRARASCVPLPRTYARRCGLGGRDALRR